MSIVFHDVGRDISPFVRGSRKNVVPCIPAVKCSGLYWALLTPVHETQTGQSLSSSKLRPSCNLPKRTVVPREESNLEISSKPSFMFCAQNLMWCQYIGVRHHQVGDGRWRQEMMAGYDV
jgi:hypothetical protein